MAPPLPLPPQQAHLWYTLTEPVTDPGLLKTYESLMAPEEAARYHRFRFAKSRHEFLLTRALVRTVLSRYGAVDPAAWRFTANAYGRPEILSPVEHCLLRFNLSNTSGMVACVVARDREIGIDVENIHRRAATVRIADRYFSRSEAAALRAMPEPMQHARFFELWTLKESYIKARGMGMSLPLGRFSFAIEPGSAARISFDPRLPDEPDSWQFVRLKPSEQHMVAVALRRRNEPDLDLVTRATVPLVT